LVRSHKQIKPTHILLLKQRKKNIKRKCSWKFFFNEWLNFV
jgi:hypothetical protein